MNRFKRLPLLACTRVGRHLLPAICLLLLAPTPLWAAACAPPAAGMVGWWPGDGNANDLASTNHGTLQGGATANLPGVVSNCFTFDGTNSYGKVSVNDNVMFQGDQGRAVCIIID